MATFLDGRIAEAVDAFDRVARLFLDTGELLRVGTPRSTRGHGLVFMDLPGHGLADADAALELERQLGHPEGVTYCLWHRAEALAALGRADEAMSDAREALGIATRLGHRGWTATSWRAVGIAAEAAGDRAAALQAYLSSLEISEHLSLFASWAAARAAVVYIAQGDHDHARALVARALGEGPPLGHFEARLAQVELAAATAAPDARELAQAALARADAGGVAQGRARVAELTGLRQGVRPAEQPG
jgi:tetratricopeptide (TPR) repeat protein